ncbi:MAG: hypothetical protein H0X66_04475 [Verrucomicrobia bacterium]|nr:hypothetical protein [Verrucomicrobiota bacterium]
MNVLQTICQRAFEKHLPLILMGGHAVIAHGHPRTTFDIDLVARNTDRNVWTDLLKELGYTIFSDRETFLQFSAPDEHTMAVDVMFVNEGTFEKFLTQSQPLPEIAKNAKVVSLQHLLALKSHALKHGHPQRTFKDLDDVMNLVEVHHIDVTLPEWRELFLKYGTIELYEKLKRISGS